MTLGAYLSRSKTPKENSPKHRKKTVQKTERKQSKKPKENSPKHRNALRQNRPACIIDMRG